MLKSDFAEKEIWIMNYLYFTQSFRSPAQFPLIFYRTHVSIHALLPFLPFLSPLLFSTASRPSTSLPSVSYPAAVFKLESTSFLESAVWFMLAPWNIVRLCWFGWLNAIAWELPYIINNNTPTEKASDNWNYCFSHKLHRVSSNIDDIFNIILKTWKCTKQLIHRIALSYYYTVYMLCN